MYGIIAHELRTPVSAIEMMTHHETEEWINDKDQVVLAVKDLLHSIDDMKMLVNPELKRDLHLEETTVTELNTAINSMVASAIALNHMDYKQSTNLPSQLESLPFTTDAYRLKACVTNIIRNACLHSEGSSVRCTIDTILDNHGSTLLRWTISDDGKGISTVQQRKMFKAFERGDSQSEGTGLGLHIAKSWIQDIGGHLQYRRLSPGSEFTVTVPLKPIQNIETSKGVASQSEYIEQYAKRLKVLFVEDDKLLIMVTTKLLGPMFAAFDHANDGIEGLEMAEADYDLILTDYFMPNMTGLEMTQQLRQKGDMRPIISATAATIGQESQELLDAGVDLILPKPLSKESILKALLDLAQQGKLPITQETSSSYILNSAHN
jgi:CheY-like chemotaxis protein